VRPASCGVFAPLFTGFPYAKKPVVLSF